MQQLRQFDKTIPTYWIARLVGFNGSNFSREFIKPVIDRSEANSVESRWVYYYWHLEDGVYEGIFDSNFQRQFLIVQGGNARQATKDEVKLWLNDYLENLSLKQQEKE